MEFEQGQVEERAVKAGRRLHDAAAVPHAMRQEAQARWGVNVEFNTSRENGNYAGPVFANEEFIAQRAGEKSVIFHRIEHIDFSLSENLKKRAEEKRLNDAILQIRYSSGQGKAFFHDPQRAAIEEMFSRIKRAAVERFGESVEFPTLSDQLEEIRKILVDQHREAKNKQFELRNGQTSRRIINQNERQDAAPQR